ncbi:hypothetical protein QYF36_003989 [Acer negundo]|nr:hypothetical protein QYF36_003989 [Acer negundo]
MRGLRQQPHDSGDTSNSSCQSRFEMVNLKRQQKIPESNWNNGTITRHNHIEILQVIDDRWIFGLLRTDI